ncbi:venom serine carboxypeptidase-like [Achroia grisella]|uniref:venom serine carboxypeptidase-like n=1 Tax=Achroia grisella TaxID=688607 RepID=UPI0027D26649|nr:venom serine carboxypeptidase-like [Achroia grisella]
MSNAVCLLLLFVTSVYGRTVLNDEKNDIVSLNDTKIDKLLVDLPVYDLPANDTNINCTSNTIDISNNIEHDSEPCAPVPKVDNGTALILTPYIEEGLIQEARNMCLVDPSLFLGIKSYSGFLTVNKTYNSNLFFWYFPVENKPVNETPWIIWLQGGPGASSMTGLFDEIGPFKFVDGTLKQNPYTWLQNHSLVFIENPVGTGYSFTDHAEGYAKDMATYSSHMYRAVRQFLQIFPELRIAPLYISGESYAGKYVPSLAMEIHKHKDAPGNDINLQGIMIGNAYVEPAMISQMIRPFYYFGLLVNEQLDIVKPLFDAFQQDIAANRSIEAKQKWNSLVTILLYMSHQKQAYNFLRDKLPVGEYVSFLASSEVKRALHVGDINFSFVNFTVNTEMAPDFLSSARPMLETLLDHYRVLAYCGQLDQMLPCVFASETYRTWKWKHAEEFLNATRSAYIFNNKLSGYYKSGGGLTEATIRGAGHMVPLDTPAPAQYLVAHWIHHNLTHSFEDYSDFIAREFVKNYSIAHYL